MRVGWRRHLPRNVLFEVRPQVHFAGPALVLVILHQNEVRVIWPATRGGRDTPCLRAVGPQTRAAAETSQAPPQSRCLVTYSRAAALLSLLSRAQYLTASPFFRASFHCSIDAHRPSPSLTSGSTWAGGDGRRQRV